ncbi:MAG: hypothetical protein SFV17_03405 [Candidatus Obscuribacter sp.]|nr:hypothetical protein [Candidatus Obscuribacter sp.]
MSKNQESSVSPVQAVVYFLVSIALLVVLLEFRVHLGFLLLILALLVLLLSLVLAYLAVFQPEFVKRSASQGVESYLFVRDLFAKVRGAEAQSSEVQVVDFQAPTEEDKPDGRTEVEQTVEGQTVAPPTVNAEEQEPGSSELQ